MIKENEVMDGVLMIKEIKIMDGTIGPELLAPLIRLHTHSGINLGTIIQTTMELDKTSGATQEDLLPRHRTTFDHSLAQLAEVAVNIMTIPHAMAGVVIQGID